MFRKTLVMLLALLILGTSLVSSCLAYAENKTVSQLRYTDIHQIEASLTIRNGTANCYGAGRSFHTDTSTTVTVTLQRRAAGTTIWTAVRTWSDTQQGTSFAYVDEEINVGSGYSYRLYVNCTVKSTAGVVLESAVIYSKTVSY